jgi:hypothetical protein
MVLAKRSVADLQIYFFFFQKEKNISGYKSKPVVCLPRTRHTINLVEFKLVSPLWGVRIALCIKPQSA